MTGKRFFYGRNIDFRRVAYRPLDALIADIGNMGNVISEIAFKDYSVKFCELCGEHNAKFQ